MIVDEGNFPSTHRDLLEEWNEEPFVWGALVVYDGPHNDIHFPGMWHLISQDFIAGNPRYHTPEPATVFVVYYDESSKVPAYPSAMWVHDGEGPMWDYINGGYIK